MLNLRGGMAVRISWRPREDGIVLRTNGYRYVNVYWGYPFWYSC